MRKFFVAFKQETYASFSIDVKEKQKVNIVDERQINQNTINKKEEWENKIQKNLML